METKLQSGTSGKVEWFKNHSLTESERNKLIEEKLSRGIKYAMMAKAIKRK